MIDKELDHFKLVRHDRHGEHQARNPPSFSTVTCTTSSGADKSRASSCTSPLYRLEYGRPSIRVLASRKGVNSAGSTASAQDTFEQHIMRAVGNAPFIRLAFVPTCKRDARRSNLYTRTIANAPMGARATRYACKIRC